MKKHYFFKLLLVAIPVSAFLLMSSSGGRDEGRSGSPGDEGSTCTACHSAGANLDLSSSITTDIPAAGYALNTEYTITVSSTSNSSKLGFQLVAENGSDAKIGTFTAGSGSRVSGSRITQSTPSSSGDWSFKWTSPATNQGDVTFYAAVNATDGNGSTSGDQVVTTNTTASVLSVANNQSLHFDMYPNPSVSNVNIQLPSGIDKANVVFYDYIGRVALSSTITNANQQINISSLSKGVYMIKVLSGTKVGTQKFIKQ